MRGARLSGDVVLEIMEADMLAVLDAAFCVANLKNHFAIEATVQSEGDEVIYRIVLSHKGESEINLPSPTWAGATASAPEPRPLPSRATNK